MTKALDFLREKGLATAAKRADRKASEGMVELYSHGNGRVGVMVEVNCETDFVGRSEAFRTFAHELALQIAASAARLTFKTKTSRPKCWSTKRKIAMARAREEGKPEAILPRIVEGYVNKFKDEVVLLRQPYIRDETMTVQQLVNQTVASTGRKYRHPALRALGTWAKPRKNQQPNRNQSQPQGWPFFVNNLQRR